jgi:hypothetical protein
MNEPEDRFGSDAAQTSVEGEILEIVHETVIKVWKLWEKFKAHISADNVSAPFERADQERLKILTRLYDGVRRFNLTIDSSTEIEELYQAVSDLQLCCMRAIGETESAVSQAGPQPRTAKI